VQEFIARGVIISTILNFLEGVKHSGLGAIIMSSMLFSAQHLHLPSIAFAVLVFIPGIFWGWLFVRHRSILGVSISHIITGIWAIQILGLNNIGIPQF
jgi:membrane protease YdiL (CAAX protease family)